MAGVDHSPAERCCAGGVVRGRLQAPLARAELGERGDLRRTVHRSGLAVEAPGRQVSPDDKKRWIARAGQMEVFFAKHWAAFRVCDGAAFILPLYGWWF